MTRTGRRYDLVLDAAGTRSVLDWVRVLAPGGRYATFGSSSTPRILQGFIVGPLLSDRGAAHASWA